jgi:hypothetical protein
VPISKVTLLADVELDGVEVEDEALDALDELDELDELPHALSATATITVSSAAAACLLRLFICASSSRGSRSQKPLMYAYVSVWDARSPGPNQSPT